MRPEENIPAIIDDLYAGTMDPAAWNKGIRATVDVVSGSAALLFGFNPATGQVLRNENHGYDPAALEQYNNYWSTKDIRIAAGLALPVGEPMYTANVLSVREYTSSEIYNEFLRPTDVPWILAFWLHKARDRVVAFSIQGTRSRGPFDEGDCERVKPLLQHLRRALEIKDRLEVAQIRSETLATSFDRFNFGVVILSSDGHIAEASSRARAFLRNGNNIRRNQDGTLWLRDPAGRELNQWIHKGTPPAGNTDGLLHVPRQLARPLTIMVTRLPEVCMPWISGGRPSWMLLLFDPDRELPASSTLIAHDLDISAREAEVAAQLSAGYDIAAVALRLGISIHTARTHLKAIFAKTGIRSQAELIRRIVSGPAGLRSTS
jgi:DNA-binding CsgD family transcriptional regulator